MHWYVGRYERAEPIFDRTIAGEPDDHVTEMLVRSPPRLIIPVTPLDEPATPLAPAAGSRSRTPCVR